MGKDKRPQLGAQPLGGKTPRIAFDPDDFHTKCPSWRFSLLQVDGPFNWSSLTGADWVFIHGRLREIERTSWVALENGKGGSHHVETYKLSGEAKGRLREINMEDHEVLFSLRLGGKPRIWGIRESNVLKVLWWDPDHLVMPVEKKHT